MRPWPPLPKLPAGISSTALQRCEQGFVLPFVQDDGQIRSLHFTPGELQSRMDMELPWQLEVDYTRTMMGFLLLKPAPAHIAMIGLGGGSLAKFCYRQLPGCHFTAVENNPHVMALRKQFAIPDDDARFAVLCDDGAAFVARHAGQFDVLLVDGFDHEGQPAALCSQAFYDDCFSALGPDGVLAVNLHQDDADYPIWLARLMRAFSGNAVEVPAPEKSNSIVFASRGPAISPRHVHLKSSLEQLDTQGRHQLRQEFARIAWSMRDLDGTPAPSSRG